FAGYKAGMTHITVNDDYKNSITKGMEIAMPVSVIECPPIKIVSLRFYKKNTKCLVAASQVDFKVDKVLARKLRLPKKVKEQKLEDIKLGDYADMKVVVHTQPKLTGFAKKTPEVFELAIGGSSLKEKVDFVKQFIGKEISVNDVFEAGEQVDVTGVTKGKGFQGTTKRFGTKVRGRKTEKAKRGIGTLGPWHPAHILFTVPQPGKMGYHTRTEHNKQIIFIGDKPEEINPKGGFLQYGLVKNPYILIKGSVFGTQKRLLRFNNPRRPNKKVPTEAPQITYISQESKQRHR
ncbi:50S ribosomal protein L3, partial [Candidatus Woesearchaeota archaeon]|nr:50S ribosomal protein L3 [Candidatus Woesearchaeota archaeon]